MVSWQCPVSISTLVAKGLIKERRLYCCERLQVKDDQSARRARDNEGHFVIPPSPDCNVVLQSRDSGSFGRHWSPVWLRVEQQIKNMRGQEVAVFAQEARPSHFHVFQTLRRSFVQPTGVNMQRLETLDDLVHESERQTYQPSLSV